MEALAPLPAGLSEVALGPHGLRAWHIVTPACRALVSRQGAQVLAFQAQDRPPLLWLSPQAHFQPGKAIRGGIPLCFPWFGPHPVDPALPAHGFARLRDWSYAGASCVGETLQLELTLAADAATRQLWPQDFSARLRLTFGRRLGLALTVANTGTSACRFAFAFHSYFPVADCREARVEGLEDSLCIDQLDASRTRRRQAAPQRFDGETDRIFLHTSGACRLVDERRDQVTRLFAPECRSVVAWNPGPLKTARLADMAPDAWQGMACVETGNVEDDAVTLPAGAARAFSLLLEQ